jgi:RimJ/RimL family protein N-acetyltransferase
MPWPPPVSLADVRRIIGEALEEEAAGTQLPFAVIHKPSGRAAGSSRYLEIRRADRALEIGSTWLGVEWQRTAVNSECKLLLLAHTFEVLGA